MKTPNLDNEINKLEVYKSNDILSEQGEDLLKEFKEIKAKINYTQCCEKLKAVNDGKNGEGMDLVRSFNKEFRSL